jgi:hypothetical protein
VLALILGDFTTLAAVALRRPDDGSWMMGKSWENGRKMMGKSWENDGKMMGKWENDGKIMSI